MTLCDLFIVLLCFLILGVFLVPQAFYVDLWSFLMENQGFWGSLIGALLSGGATILAGYWAFRVTQKTTGRDLLKERLVVIGRVIDQLRFIGTALNSFEVEEIVDGLDFRGIYNEAVHGGKNLNHLNLACDFFSKNFPQAININNKIVENDFYLIPYVEREHFSKLMFDLLKIRTGFWWDPQVPHFLKEESEEKKITYLVNSILRSDIGEKMIQVSQDREVVYNRFVDLLLFYQKQLNEFDGIFIDPEPTR